MRLLTCLLSLAILLTQCAPRAAERAGFTPESKQQQEVIAFYNLENLFDTDDDPQNPGDDEWLPSAAKQWTPQRYQEKLGRLATTIATLGGGASTGGPALLGVCEVENEKVLRDLLTQPPLATSNYGIVHRESPDWRGIDCGLLYRREKFEVIGSQALYVDIGTRSDGSPRTTRDILMVVGQLEGAPLTVFVNHWPSRRGGEAASRPGREAAAQLLRAAVDSIQAADPAMGIIIVGDFNDDPTSPSLAKTLQATGKRGDAAQTGLYNPMTSLYRQGEGSLGYRDSWNLFDQIIVSDNLAQADEGWRLKQARVLRQPNLLQPSGRFKGYPLRTYVGNSYLGGYSDHLPVYAILTRPKS